MEKINLIKPKGLFARIAEYIKKKLGAPPLQEPYLGPERVIHLTLSDAQGQVKKLQISEKELGKKPAVIGRTTSSPPPEHVNAHLLLTDHPMFYPVEAIITLEPGRRITIKRGKSPWRLANQTQKTVKGREEGVKEELTRKGLPLHARHSFLFPGLVKLHVSIQP